MKNSFARGAFCEHSLTIKAWKQIALGLSYCQQQLLALSGKYLSTASQSVFPTLISKRKWTQFAFTISNPLRRMSENGASTSKHIDGSELPFKKPRHILKFHGSYQLKQEEEGVEEGQCSALSNLSEADRPLRRNVSFIEWHTQQMAKALFDNTINSMIEEVGFPLPEIENLIHDECYLEDEAVRMAIRSHGLQKPCSCTQKRHNRPLPENIPFHQRNNFIVEDDPSTSLKSSLEADILSEAVTIAIQKKGLGASQNGSL
ncbi:uncharacterized protein LOC106670070 [Cimex lectularius]|uniref:Uncharacterized protein n=1 Tax=Cimex lectularius TaxID=79782 RepID=A0A8I6S059_CIMLE|nr:uncharacterized protein LOC106670070 [Cimex lectularius]